MTEKRDGTQGGPTSHALQREAERVAKREARLAEALRSNLRRRKEQARTRAGSNLSDSGVASPPRDQRAGNES